MKPSKAESRSSAIGQIDGERGNAPSPRIKLVRSPGEPIRAEVDHPDYEVGVALLMKAVGTDNRDFLDGLLGHLVLAGANGKKASESQTNFLISLVKGVEPKDQVEAMLSAQMAVVHNAVMLSARRLSVADSVQQIDTLQNAFNKLARTFAAQVSALKDYRSRGEQKMVVQHVHIADGAQAVIGTVTGGGAKNGDRPHVLEHAQGVAMPRQIKADGPPVPRTGC